MKRTTTLVAGAALALQAATSAAELVTTTITAQITRFQGSTDTPPVGVEFQFTATYDNTGFPATEALEAAFTDDVLFDGLYEINDLYGPGSELKTTLSSRLGFPIDQGGFSFAVDSYAVDANPDRLFLLEPGLELSYSGVQGQIQTGKMYFHYSNDQTTSVQFDILSSTTTAVANASALSCIGFDAPLDSGPVRVKKNRALPLKAVLQDEFGNDIFDVVPPILQVTFTNGDTHAQDVSDEALSAGAGTEGNQFEYVDGQWRFNLKTKNYTAPGNYEVRMLSGDTSVYVMGNECVASFVID